MTENEQKIIEAAERLSDSFEKWIYQPWYDSNSVFKLIEITQNKMEHFGVE